MSCNNTLCLDDKTRTKIIFGSTSMTLDEFIDKVNNDPSLKKKLEEIK